MATQQSPKLDLTRRNFLSIAGVGTATLFLASCGVGGGTEKGAAKALRAAFAQPITDLDPQSAATAVDEASLIAKRLIFDTLTTRHGGDLKPSLATKWEQPDETTWRFTIRDDVKFHDGTKLTSADVVASVKRMQSVTSAQSSLWAPVKDIVAEGDTTVVITTDGPLGTLLVNLTLMFIIPAASVNNPDFMQKPIGSGPYKVDSFVPSSDLKLSRSKAYWGTAGKSPSVEMPYIAETSSAITSLSTGEVDMFWPIPSDLVGDLSSNKKVKIEKIPSYVYFFNWFNCGRAPFTDVRVRQALWHAIDIESVVKELYGDGAVVMTAPIPSTVFGYAKQPPYKYDVALAKDLLKQAGLADGFKSSLMWFDQTGPLATELAQAMISAWSKIGVIVEAQSVEKAVWLNRLNSLDWDMDLQTNTVTTGDADFTLGRLYTSKAHRMAYSNLKLDGVLDQAHQVSDAEKREKFYAEACKTIWDDAVGIFPATIVTSYGTRSNLQGFVPLASNQPDLSTISVQ
jgi:peptide/nickel transport system substrate-binding protein